MDMCDDLHFRRTKYHDLYYCFYAYILVVHTYVVIVVVSSVTASSEANPAKIGVK